jgi:hypothetical protein
MGDNPITAAKCNADGCTAQARFRLRSGGVEVLNCDEHAPAAAVPIFLRPGEPMFADAGPTRSMTKFDDTPFGRGRIVRRWQETDGSWMVEVELVGYGVAIPTGGFSIGCDQQEPAPKRPLRQPVPRRLRPRWLGPLNFIVLQWLGVRLQRSLAYRDGAWCHDQWNLRRWVLPLTGWWSRYVETRGAR